MIERKILIGIVTSTEYCDKIKDVFNVSLIESASAKKMMGWIWKYYQEKKKAPGRNAPMLFWKHAKGLPTDIAEEISSEILPSLDAEYDSDSFDVSYMVEETIKHFNERKLAVLSENIITLTAKGDIEAAQKLIAEHKLIDNAINKLDEHVVSVSQIRRKKVKKPTTLLSPWLKEGQTTIIYGNFGSGKSLLTISVAYILGLKNFDTKESEIGSWQVKHPTGTLYIDGELGELEMEERITQFEWIGRQSAQHRMRILSVPDYQLMTEDTFSLSKRENQLKITQWLRENPEYKLVVLDSASTLFGLVEENDNSEWNNKINPFLRDLRTLNVACLMLHHSGKDGKRGLRGASSMGAMAHNIFKLIDHPEKDKDLGEAWFTLSKDKQRMAGFSFKTFSIHYTQNKEKTKTYWHTTKF